MTGTAVFDWPGQLPASRPLGLNTLHSPGPLLGPPPSLPPPLSPHRVGGGAGLQVARQPGQQVPAVGALLEAQNQEGRKYGVWAPGGGWGAGPNPGSGVWDAGGWTLGKKEPCRAEPGPWGASPYRPLPGLCCPFLHLDLGAGYGDEVSLQTPAVRLALSLPWVSSGVGV